MKMKSRLTSLLFLLATSGPLLSATELERLNALCAEQELQIKQLELKIARLTDTPPPSHKAAESTSEPAAASTSYVVKSGDSIERIALRNGTTPSILASLNGLKTNSIIHPGQKLKLPGARDAIASSPTPAKPENRVHIVKSGETFYRISRQYGVSVNQLIESNPQVDHRALRVGQKIEISTKASGPLASSTPSTPSPSKPAASLNSTPSQSITNAPAPAPLGKPRATDRPVRIDKEITYGLFASNNNTTTRRLDELNGLELDPSTVLAQGSELYIPAQP